MATTPRGAKNLALSLPFEQFWAWIQAHANCIIRAGTPEVLLFDHDDFHWHLASEEEGTELVQLVRGKELVAEMVVLTGDIAYVQAEPGEAEEYLFECIVETERAREAVYHFVMAHGFDETEPPSARRWTQ